MPTYRVREYNDTRQTKKRSTGRYHIVRKSRTNKSPCVVCMTLDGNIREVQASHSRLNGNFSTPTLAPRYAKPSHFATGRPNEPAQQRQRWLIGSTVAAKIKIRDSYIIYIYIYSTGTWRSFTRPACHTALQIWGILTPLSPLASLCTPACLGPPVGVSLSLRLFLCPCLSPFLQSPSCGPCLPRASLLQL